MNQVLRFAIVLFGYAAAFALLAQLMLADDDWLYLAVWGAALGLAVVDAYFRGREKQKG